MSLTVTERTKGRIALSPTFAGDHSDYTAIDYRGTSPEGNAEYTIRWKAPGWGTVEVESVDITDNMTYDIRSDSVVLTTVDPDEAGHANVSLWVWNQELQTSSSYSVFVSARPFPEG